MTHRFHQPRPPPMPACAAGCCLRPQPSQLRPSSHGTMSSSGGRSGGSSGGGVGVVEGSGHLTGHNRCTAAGHIWRPPNPAGQLRRQSPPATPAGDRRRPPPKATAASKPRRPPPQATAAGHPRRPSPDRPNSSAPPARHRRRQRQPATVASQPRSAPPLATAAGHPGRPPRPRCRSHRRGGGGEGAGVGGGGPWRGDAASSGWRRRQNCTNSLSRGDAIARKPAPSTWCQGLGSDVTIAVEASESRR